MLALHATSQGCLVGFDCLTTASISASFLGGHPSQCQKYTAKISFPGIDMTDPSSLSTTAPKSLSSATKTPLHACLQFSLLAFSSVILAASAANLHPCYTSLWNCSSISSFPILLSIPKKMRKVPLYLVMYFFSVLYADKQGTYHRFCWFSRFFSCSLILPVLGSFPCLSFSSGQLSLANSFFH